MDKDEEIKALKDEVQRLKQIVFPDRWTPIMEEAWDASRTDDAAFRALRDLRGITK